MAGIENVAYRAIRDLFIKAVEDANKPVTVDDEDVVIISDDPAIAAPTTIIADDSAKAAPTTIIADDLAEELPAFDLACSDEGTLRAFNFI